MLNLEVNPITYPTAMYDNERVIQIDCDSPFDKEEIFAIVTVDIDGKMPENIEEEIFYALARKYGKRAIESYVGYDDVTELFA